MASDIPSPPVCILSLDGGGVRGLSEILILKDIFYHLNQKLGRSPDDQLQPWQVFDLIAGTSTGGIIAVMLGRLRMSLDQCEDAYLNLSAKIFKPKQSSFNFVARLWDLSQANPRFDAKVLENAMKTTIGKFEEEDALLKDEASCCKIFVVATQESNTETAILRSYENGRSQVLYHEWKIWEACRATSAATGFFDPIEIGNYQRFIDGAVGCNNPIDEAYHEARQLWKDRDHFIITLGTGSEPGREFGGRSRRLLKIIDSMKHIVTETEKTAERFYRLNKITLVDKNLYFRFNVNQGLKQIGLHEYEQRKAIAVATQSYLAEGEVSHKLSLCADRLSEIVLLNANGSIPAGNQQVDMQLNHDTWSQPSPLTEMNQVSAAPRELDTQQFHRSLRYSTQTPLGSQGSASASRFLPPTSPTTSRSGQLSRTTIASGPSSLAGSFERTPSAQIEGINIAFLKHIIKGEDADVNIVLAWLRDIVKRSQIRPSSFDTALLEVSQLKKTKKLKQRYGIRWMELVDLLLECAPDVNCVDPQTQLTPLMFAALDNILGVISRLLDANACLEMTDGIYHRTALMYAVKNNHLRVVNQLIRKIEERQLFHLINATDGQGLTALAIATRDFGPRSEIAALLRDHGGQLVGIIGSNGHPAEVP